MSKSYDFSGWATKNGIRCSDGRIIQKNAFKNNDGETVPLVWNHNHNDPLDVLGHALLENRREGVYAYCTFNDTEAGKTAKELVKHGDVTALSIYANKLKQEGSNVFHGAIREVSLVLAGANPGASIVSVLYHNGEENMNEALIYTGENLSLFHSDRKDDEDDDIEVDDESENKVDNEKNVKGDNNLNKENKMADNEKTIGEVFESMSEEQKNVVYFMIGKALEEANGEHDDEDEGEGMKHNVFDGSGEMMGNELSHSEVTAIFDDARRYGSLKDSVLEHGITNIEYLFPDAKAMNDAPDFISRDQTWISDILDRTHHTPFSRVKSLHANITADEARAKGYTKTHKKLDEIFTLLKRTTDPQTVYKKQKLERDDVIDITDFDVVSWMKTEMRMMLDEEIARAALIGDGRMSSSDDKISESHIRPIWTDDELYTIHSTLEFTSSNTADEKAKAFIKEAIKSRKNYKGSGNPTLYTTEDMLTDMLLLEDTTGRVIYDSEDKLATTLRVDKIVTVPVMEGQTRTVDSDTLSLMGIVVNPFDYNIGADKGGAINLFDDFDIDYNAQKYLIETRCSGALTKPYSAIAIESKTTA